MLQRPPKHPFRHLQWRTLIQVCAQPVGARMRRQGLVEVWKQTPRVRMEEEAGQKAVLRGVNVAGPVSLVLRDTASLPSCRGCKALLLYVLHKSVWLQR